MQIFSSIQFCQDRVFRLWRKSTHFPVSFLLVLVTYFIGCYTVALHWHGLGIFSRFDLLFEADPNTNLGSLANGWGWGRNAFTHPLLEYFAIFPRLGGEVLAKVFELENKLLLRQYLSMLYAPFFGAVSGAICFRVCLLNGFTVSQSTQVAFVYLFSFSGLMFSIIPESYSFSGCILVALLYYFRLCEENGTGNHWIWLAFGILLIGVTITNAVVFGMAYGLFLWKICGRNVHHVLFLALLAVLAATLIGLTLLKFGVYITDSRIGSEGDIDWISKFSSFSLNGMLERLVSILQAFQNTYTNMYWSTNNVGITFIKSEHSLTSSLASILPLLTLFTITAPLLLTYYSKNFCLLLFGILIFNIFLHLFFGREFFLYSTHWLAALTLILAPSLVKTVWVRRVFGLLFFTAGVSNIYFISALVTPALQPLIR